MKILQTLLVGAFLAGGSFAHTIESAGAPPPGIDPGVAAAVQKDGIRVLNESNKIICEVWFRNTAPPGTPTAEDSVSLTTIPHGSLLGVVRFPERGSDRRGQTIKPGVYTLRLSFYPPNGEHQGIAPQRDFAILSAAADDKDPKSTPAFEPLMNASRKVSGTGHPAVLSIWKSESAPAHNTVAQEGEHDWVLKTKIGDVPVSMIVEGKSDH